MNSFVDFSGTDSKAPNNKCLQNWEHCPHYIENYIFRKMKASLILEKNPKKHKIFKWSENTFTAAKANRVLDFFGGKFYEKVCSGILTEAIIKTKRKPHFASEKHADFV